jgi:hypothetical protein
LPLPAPAAAAAAAAADAAATFEASGPALTSASYLRAAGRRAAKRSGPLRPSHLRIPTPDAPT